MGDPALILQILEWLVSDTKGGCSYTVIPRGYLSTPLVIPLTIDPLPDTVQQCPVLPVVFYSVIYGKTTSPPASGTVQDL